MLLNSDVLLVGQKYFIIFIFYTYYNPFATPELVNARTSRHAHGGEQCVRREAVRSRSRLNHKLLNLWIHSLSHTVAVKDRASVTLYFQEEAV